MVLADSKRGVVYIETRLCIGACRCKCLIRNRKLWSFVVTVQRYLYRLVVLRLVIW